jgi:toxin-antitoxin system PIN domain toxin
MIAVDTNILVYAHREEFPLHEPALNRLVQLAEGPDAWALPVFCVGEFLRVVTHPRLFNPPSALSEATEAVEELLGSPGLVVLNPGERFFPLVFEAAQTADARGNLLYDAQIVALCREHGVRDLLSEDRDFKRFEGITLHTLR